MRYTNDGSDYDRGYYGGHDDSEAARRGKADREAEAERFRRMASQPAVTPTATSRSPRHTSGAAAPATFVGTVKACSVLGAFLGIGYAFLMLQAESFGASVAWAAKGLIWGMIAGVAMYGAIVIARSAIAVLAVAVKLAFWAAVILGALYFISR